jgi:catechol 2,3-dioxygenase-like lactoylglutathione lyase family enzyme
MTTQVTKAFESSPFAITLLSENIEASKDFYQNKLGLTKVFEDEVSAVFKCGQTMINLLSDSQGPELLEPAKVAPANAGTRALFTLKCAEIDQAAAELEAAGVTLLNGPIDRPWGVRTVSFLDPSGHAWELANHS